MGHFEKTNQNLDGELKMPKINIRETSLDTVAERGQGLFPQTQIHSQPVLSPIPEAVSHKIPFKKAENPDPRTTDDHFLMAIDAGHGDVDAMMKVLESTGAVELNIVEQEQAH